MVLAHLGAGGGPGWWILFPLAWLLLFWGAVVLFLRGGFRRWRGAFPPGRSGESVLAERFARGELTEEEYWEKLAVLKESAKR